ncbi:MAG: NYN domain-containing protein [Pseudomonadota bacterium]
MAETGQTRDRPLLAVLIDADNVPARHAEAILKEISSIGEPALRRVYGDWSSGQLKSWSSRIRSLGLNAHQETANTQGKNASDIGLVIDAMDILHTRRFDGFVLVSSDSDFTALANRLREDGLMVIGIGEAKTPEALITVCNRFIFLENIAEPEAGAKATPRKGGKAAADALPLIEAAMDRLDHDGEWYSLGLIGQTIQAERPDFDTRTYGYRKLSTLVGDIKSLETRKEANHLMIRLRE